MNSLLKQELGRLNRALDAQIAEVHRLAEEMGIESNRIKDMNGRLMLAELLVAKANVLLALTNLGTR